MAPPTEFTTSFMRAACGALSSSITRADSARSAGRAFSRASAGPPATTVSWAFSAAALEPSSGAATKVAPRAPPSPRPRWRWRRRPWRCRRAPRPCRARPARRRVHRSPRRRPSRRTGSRKTMSCPSAASRGRGGALRALLHERLRLGGGAVPDGDGVAGLAQVVGHGRAHGPRSEKSDLHGSNLVAQGGGRRKRERTRSGGAKALAWRGAACDAGWPPRRGRGR